MIKRILSILLAMVFCLGVEGSLIRAEEPIYMGGMPTEPELPLLLSRADVYLPGGSDWIGGGNCEPWTSGPVATLTNVYDRYYRGMGALSFFNFATDVNSTVTFNQDVAAIEIEWGEYADSVYHIAKAEVLKAGTVYNVKDLIDMTIIVENSVLQTPSVGDEVPGLGIFISFQICENVEDIRYGGFDLSEYFASDFTPTSAEAPSAWAAEQVSAAISTGIVPQALQSKYTQATTRAEFCALAVALYETVTGAEISGRTSFNDTTDINIQKLASLGVVSGVGNNNFAPDQKLTREQAATMLSRLATSMGNPMPKQAPTFADNGLISSWAVDGVGEAQAAGIMSGVGNNTFAPQAEYTREQSIITMMRLLGFVK